MRLSGTTEIRDLLMTLDKFGWIRRDMLMYEIRMCLMRWQKLQK